MNAEKTRKVIQERFIEIHNEVFQQMINVEKNSYDSEISLPECVMIEDMPLKKKYRLVKSVCDTVKKQKRRNNQLSTLEKHILNEDIEYVKTKIKESYYASITEVSEKIEFIDTQYQCNQKTARKLINSLFEMIGYNNKNNIPQVLIDDIVECVKQWIPHSKTVYKCCKTPEKVLDYMNEEEMIYTYKIYLLAKKIILIGCTNKKEYEEEVAYLHKNKKMNAIYNVGRIIQ